MSSPYRPQVQGDEPTVAYEGGAPGQPQNARPPADDDVSSTPHLSTSTPDLHKVDQGRPDFGLPLGTNQMASDERPDPFSAPTPAVARDSGRYGDDLPSSWSSAYADDAPSAGPAVTSVYPQSTPEYAPAGYPSAYAPATVVPPPAFAVVPEKPSSRVGPGFLSALIGLVLSAGGAYLLVRFGFRAGLSLTKGDVSIRNSGLGLLGALLLFAATVLNGWSPWSTLLPGIAFAGLGGWALFDASAFRHVGQWVRSVLDLSEVTNALATGFLVALGLVLLGASVAAMLARSGGKRDGRILGRRDAAPVEGRR